MESREVKLFISSPGDVVDERKRLMAVLRRLNGRFAGSVRFVPINWPDHFYKAHDTFQAQIEQPAACDIVISIFWTRLGTELPAEFGERLPDGRPYPSGTAYELLTAIEAARQKALPDVYVFRKTKEPPYPVNDEAKAQAFDEQLRQLRAFWEEWFRNKAGQFRAAFQNFITTDEFETHAEKLLQHWLDTKGLLGRQVRWRIEERGSPFRSLEPFDAAHAEVFFGRTQEIERGRESLVEAAARGAPFLLIVGASGTGKSSLARAGLIPRLMAPGATEGVDVWRTADMKVGLGQDDPLRGLAVALLEALPELTQTPNATPAGLARQLAMGGETAAGLVRWALEQAAIRTRTDEGYERPVSARLILLVDQFESLFAATVAAEQRTAFVAALDALVRSGLVWMVTTLRSTEYALLQGNPTLLRLKEAGATLDLAPPDDVAVDQVIRGPAEAAGLVYEREATGGRSLDDVLRADTAGADALPLLQFTLQRLFEEKRDRTLTFEAYRALGGIEGAIAAEAERVVGALPTDSQNQLPWLLRHLVGAGRRRGDSGMTLREMVLDDGELDSHRGAVGLIEALVRARVLVLDGGGDAGPRRARLAHEAVLRGWQRARTFVDSNARYFHQVAELQGALDRWTANDLGRDHLLRGTPLSVAEDLVRDFGADLPVRMREFVLASRRAADSGRRIAYAIAACMAVLFVGAAAGGILAFVGEQKAAAERNEALIAQSRYVAQIARRLNQAADHGTALALALEVLPATASRPDRPFDILAEGALLEAVSGLSERAVLKGHQGPVRSASFSPDGKRVMTASWDNTARLWDAENGRELIVLRGHENGLSSATFSTDGTRVVTASWDRTARLWDTRTGLELAVLRGHEGVLWSAAFSTDGKRVVTASWDRTARLWDAQTGRELAVLRGHEGNVSSASFSSDGTRVVTASQDKTARLWDVQSGRELAILQGHDGAVEGASFSPNGARVVTASWDNTARLWDVQSGRELAVLRGHEGTIDSASFSPNGTRVVTASKDRTARLWDARTGSELAVLRGHEDEVWDASFLTDGIRVVTASKDRTARLWNVQTGRELAVLRTRINVIGNVGFSPDGSRVVRASFDDTARLWDTRTGRELAVLRGHKDVVWSASFSSDMARVATASEDKTARLWDAQTGRELAVLRGHENVVLSASFSTDGTRVVTGSRDNAAGLWDAQTGRELAILRGHEDSVLSASFSPDGTRVVTASRDKAARLWDAQTGRELAILRGHESAVLSASFSPDGTQVATASEDKTARLWDAQTGRELAVLRGHEDAVLSASFSPDGTQVVTASQDRTARLWDNRTGRELAALRGYEGEALSASISTDGTRMIVTTRDRSAHLWQLRRGQDLIDYACSVMPRPLSYTQRDAFFLEREPKHPRCNLKPWN